MRRRDVIVGLAGLGAFGGAALSLSGSNGTRPRSNGAVPGSNETSFDSDGTERREETPPVSSVDLETVDAPGSEAGTMAIPEPGVVTFVDFFATWCHPCEEMMGPLGGAYAEVGSDVQFVSVTNELIGQAITREELRRWWRDNDGSWTVALDADGTLTRRLDATALPTAVVLDRDNVVTWSDRGVHSAEELLEPIHDALDEGGT